MAKKKETAKVVQEEVVEVSTPVMEKPITKTPKVETPKKPKWEFKDRLYILKDGISPLSYSVPCKNMLWFDEEQGFNREVTYSTNQRTVFVDEFKGRVNLGRVVFRNGTLSVPKENVNLQKILSIYHPFKDTLYFEFDEVANAKAEVADIEVELEAMNAAYNLDVDMAEAIMRAEIGSEVSKLSSKELKRDVLVFARRNPDLFLDLLEDDNIHLRNVGIKATEMGIISLSGDNRTFTWGTNNRKLMTVPFDEHPYSALAAWFKTDEGMEVLNSIEKRLN